MRRSFLAVVVFVVLSLSLVNLAAAATVYSVRNKAAATVYHVRNYEDWLDVMAKLEIVPEGSLNSLYQTVYILESSDVEIQVMPNSELVFNTEFYYIKGKPYSCFGPHAIDVTSFGPGAIVTYGWRDVITNKAGEQLTPEYLAAICDIRDESLYKKYRDHTVVELYSYLPFNLGEDAAHIRVQEDESMKPSPEELAEQQREYQEYLARKAAGKRAVGIKKAGESADEEEEEEEDDEWVPEPWTPSVKLQGTWLIPTKWEERTPYMVELRWNNEDIVMISDIIDPIYEQLLSPVFGEHAHFKLRVQTSHWLEYSTEHESFRHTRLSGYVSLKNAYVPENLFVVRVDHIIDEATHGKGYTVIHRSHYEYPRVTEIENGKPYFVISKELLENGLITGGGSLEDRARLIALPSNAHDEDGNLKDNITIGKITINGQDYETIEFEAVGDKMVIPAVNVKKVIVEAGKNLTLDDEPVLNEVTLPENGHCVLTSSSGKAIGKIVLVKRSNEEILDSLASLGELSADEEALLEKILSEDK